MTLDEFLTILLAVKEEVGDKPVDVQFANTGMSDISLTVDFSTGTPKRLLKVTQ